mgnify:CR=1 FL=1
MVGVPGDEQVRTDESGFPVNRGFADVPQDQPIVEAEPGYENEVCAYNLFAYISRSDVTWNPSVVSACKESLYCPTSEEFILPVIHGNDRVEWFVQLSDEIVWDVQDRDSGAARAKVTMKAGDVAAMAPQTNIGSASPISIGGGDIDEVLGRKIENDAAARGNRVQALVPTAPGA